MPILCLKLTLIAIALLAHQLLTAPQKLVKWGGFTHKSGHLSQKDSEDKTYG